MDRFASIVDQLRAPMTVSSTQSVNRVNVVAPQTVEECNALRAWAESAPMTCQPAASTEQIEKHLEFLAATLPSKNVDDESGRRRFAVYVSLLGQYSNEALQFMAREACRAYDWFPTPRQCLDLIANYRPPASERETALRLCADFAENRFAHWLVNIRNGQPVGDVPEKWLRIAVEQGAMRRLSDGSYVSRALYQGPTKPYSPPPREPFDPSVLEGMA